MNVTIRDFEKLKQIEDMQSWVSYAPDGTRMEMKGRDVNGVDFSTLRHVALDIIDNELYENEAVTGIRFKSLLDREIKTINRIDDINEVAYLIFLKFKKEKVDEALIFMKEIYSGIPDAWENQLLVHLSAQVKIMHSVFLERCVTNALKDKLPERTKTGLCPDFLTVREHPIIIKECPELKPYL